MTSALCALAVAGCASSSTTTRPVASSSPAATATTRTAAAPLPTDPSWDEFVPAATQPTLDLNALHQRLSYPDAARRNGIEGRVLLYVLVDEMGRPVSFKVAESPSPTLNDAAVDAVMSMQFTPGMISGKPARLWVAVPVHFALD